MFLLYFLMSCDNYVKNLLECACRCGSIMDWWSTEIDRESLPLSLQECCYLYLAGTISDYPLKYLNLLPTTLRRSLLSRLSAIDLNRLEGTSFAEGIETLPYWDKIHKRFTNYLPEPLNEYEFVKVPFRTPISCLSPKPTAKDMILDSIVRCAIEVNRKWHYCYECCRYICMPLASLSSIMYWNFINSKDEPSVAKLLRYSRATMVCSDLSIVVTNRTDPSIATITSFIGDDLYPPLRIRIVRMLIGLFGKFPKVINTSLPQEKTIWKIHEDEIVRKFLSRTEALCLSGTHMIPENVFSDMTAPFTGSRLKSLLVNTELSGDYLERIFHFFAAQGLKGKNNCTPYDRLEQISAGTFLAQEQNPKKQNNPLFLLASIISFQKNLKHVRLYGYFGYSPASEKLMSAVSKLVTQPQLESLTVEGFTDNCSISVHKFAKIIVNFLSNSATHKQHLTFRTWQLVHTQSSAITFFKLALMISKMSHINEGKTLDITGIQLPVEILRLLSRVPAVCFDTLSLSLYPMLDIFHELPNLTVAQHIVLSNGYKYDDEYNAKKEEAVVEQISSVLTNCVINKLTLTGVMFSTSITCEMFAQALCNHAQEMKSLSFIHFDHCLSCVNTDVECLQIIFKALADLAQVVPLEIIFDEDPLQEFPSNDNIALFYKVWKEVSGRRIHKLTCLIFNTDEESESKLEEMVNEFFPTRKYTNEDDEEALSFSSPQ